MDLDKYLNEYNNVSREELKKIKDSTNSELMFEAQIRSLHEDREKEKRYGRPALRSRPLVHVLSVSVQPKNDNEDKPLAIYGRINAEFCDSRGMVVHELYKRDCNVAEILGTSSTLRLNGPEYSCWPKHACIPLFRSRVNVLLFDGADNVFAEKSFFLDDTEIEDGYEQVKSKFIRCEHGSLTVQYIAIPFGVNCRIEVRIHNRKVFDKHDFVNVNGKIAVRYANTYGNYFSEECVLFEKQYNDFERSSDDESDDALSSNLNIPWRLRPHKSKPWPSPAVEIFSVFIGREKSKAVQIYGSVEVLSDDYGICYIFKRDEKNVLGLSEHMKSAPILDGSRVFEDFSSLEMKFDIKDVDGRLAIKGYVVWGASAFDSSLWHEKQLCSLIQGQHGFAAHYSIFQKAVGANIKVFLNLKTGWADVDPKVCGSLIAHYNCYDYLSRYNKDYYRIVLFRRTQDDSIQPGADSTIPLSRSMVVVPSYSSLIVNVDLSFGVPGQKLSGAEEIEIGEGCKTIETDDWFLRIELDWCEIK